MPSSPSSSSTVIRHATAAPAVDLLERVLEDLAQEAGAVLERAAVFVVTQLYVRDRKCMELSEPCAA